MDNASVTTEIELPVSTETAWELITDSEALGEWFDATVELDPQIGHEGTIHFHQRDDKTDDHDEPTVVLIEDVQVGERLVWRWASATQPPSLVEFQLQPFDIDSIEHVRIVIIERPIAQGVAAPGTRGLASALAVR